MSGDMISSLPIWIYNLQLDWQLLSLTTKPDSPNAINELLELEGNARHYDKHPSIIVNLSTLLIQTLWSYTKVWYSCHWPKPALMYNCVNHISLPRSENLNTIEYLVDKKCNIILYAIYTCILHKSRPVTSPITPPLIAPPPSKITMSDCMSITH